MVIGRGTLGICVKATWIAVCVTSTCLQLAKATEVQFEREVLEKIRSLPPNTGLNLGRASVIGPLNDTAREFGLDRTGPQRRDYSLKMVWAPDRQRALYLGANHGRPHRLNDVWEFDLAAMKWILLYAPDLPRGYRDLGKDFSDVHFENGVLVTERGGPAVIGHTWSGITYDRDRRLLLFMGPWVTDQIDAVQRLGGDPEALYKGPPLWSFDAESAKWSVLKTPQPWPRAPFGALLEYVPELGGSIWHMNNWQMRATWLYRTDSNRWAKLSSPTLQKDFSSQAPGRELVGYYDKKRAVVIARQGYSTFHLDIQRAIWLKVDDPQAQPSAVPEGHDARNVMYADPASGHGLLVDFRTGSIWAYDPIRTTWEQKSPLGDQMPREDKQLSYFDEDKNVLVVIGGLNVWVYRYRNLNDSNHH